MGVLEELIKLFQTLGWGSTVRIVTLHGPTPSVRLHRGLRQGNAKSALLYLLLLEPLLRSLAPKAQGDIRRAVPPLVQAYSDDLLMIAHSLPQFLEYAAAIAQYLTDMCMFLNVRKCAYATTARIPSIMVRLIPTEAATPWVCPGGKGTVPYPGLCLDPTGLASMKENHILRCEALFGWCKNTLGPASVPHEVMTAVVGGIVRYAAQYLPETEEAVVQLNVAIKTAALQFENLPKDLCNVAVRSSNGLKLADVRVLCRDSVVATLAQLAHYRSAMVRDELRAMPGDLHTQYGVFGQFLVPSTQHLWSKCREGGCVPSRSVLPLQCSEWGETTCRERAGKGWPKARWALRHSGQLSSSAWKAIHRNLREVRVDGVRCPSELMAALPLLLWWAALDGDSRVLWLWHHQGPCGGAAIVGGDAA